MKKYMLFALCAAFTTVLLPLAAEEVVVERKVEPVIVTEYITDETLRPEDEWTPFQIVFLPKLPSYAHNSNVYGIKSGWPITCGIGRVRGLEISWFYSGTEHIRGVQASWLINDNRFMQGLQVTWILNINRVMFDGIQASCIANFAGNLQGLQCGGFNMAKNFTGFQPGVFGNIANDFTGFQLGLYNVADDMRGFQLSGVNVSDACDGLQFGFVNVAKERGVQLGLINIIKGSPLPFFPIFNICL